MLQYANKGATLMCTGCPGAPAKLDASSARTVKIGNNQQLTEDDKKIQSPGFGMCVAIPTAPKKCNPSLVQWSNLRSDVKIKGKKALLFPNIITCTAGPGVITMVDSGSRTTTIGATEPDSKKYPCDWKICKEHEVQIDYNDTKDENALVGKTGEDLGWPRPSCFESVYGVHKPSSSSTRNTIKATGKTRKESKTNQSYQVQQHHVIPRSTFKQDLQDLKNNLILKGWPINDHTFNGIVLPEHPADIFWHDLQCHAGIGDSCHAAYTSDIIKKLESIETDSKELCTEDEQDQLIQMMYDFATNIRNKIINWKIIVYPSVSTNMARIASFKNAGLTPPMKPNNRKFPE